MTLTAQGRHFLRLPWPGGVGGLLPGLASLSHSPAGARWGFPCGPSAVFSHFLLACDEGCLPVRSPRAPPAQEDSSLPVSPPPPQAPHSSLWGMCPCGACTLLCWSPCPGEGAAAGGGGVIAHGDLAHGTVCTGKLGLEKYRVAQMLSSAAKNIITKRRKQQASSHSASTPGGRSPVA